jgi:hypothetical protein
VRWPSDGLDVDDGFAFARVDGVGEHEEQRKNQRREQARAHKDLFDLNHRFGFVWQE